VENSIEKSDKRLKVITLAGNILLWVLLPFSLFFAFGSMFAADAGFTTKLYETILMTGIMLAFYSPLIVLAGAITSLILIIKKKYVLSGIFEVIPLGWIIIGILLFVLSGYIR